MDLLAHLKANGQTLSVSNIKVGTNITDKIVPLVKIKAEKEIKEKIEKVEYELRYSAETHFFDLNKSVLTRFPELNEDGIGFAVINDPVNKKVYLYVCGSENEFNATPRIMAKLNGAKKSTKFKSAALLYFALESGLFKDDKIMKRLVDSDQKNLLTIEPFEAAVNTNQLNMFENTVDSNESVEETVENETAVTQETAFTNDALDMTEEDTATAELDSENSEENDDFNYVEEKENVESFANLDEDELFSLI